eukprot:15331355-Alexandrium_andersonii.AAC.1
MGVELSIPDFEIQDVRDLLPQWASRSECPGLDVDPGLSGVDAGLNAAPNDTSADLPFLDIDIDGAGMVQPAPASTAAAPRAEAGPECETWDGPDGPLQDGALG